MHSFSLFKCCLSASSHSASSFCFLSASSLCFLSASSFCFLSASSTCSLFYMQPCILILWWNDYKSKKHTCKCNLPWKNGPRVEITCNILHYDIYILTIYAGHILCSCSTLYIILQLYQVLTKWLHLHWHSTMSWCSSSSSTSSAEASFSFCSSLVMLLCPSLACVVHAPEHTWGEV